MSTVAPSGALFADARDALRRARAYLARVAEPPATNLTAFVDVHGPIEAAARVRAGDVPDAVQEETIARRDQDLVDEDLAGAAAVGARLVLPEDDEWPAWRLLCLSAAASRGITWAAPPLALWVRGPARLADILDTAVTVVGARAASGYGEHVAAEFGYRLAAAGVTVVAGASFGVHGAAHRGALAADGPTLAVLSCGIDIDYPTSHSSLIDRIAERGLVISEYPPGTPPARHRFTTRRRLLAGLSDGTVLVEAGARGESRFTGVCAAALGCSLMAVPGPITSRLSDGCHELMRAGTALPVSSVAEIHETLAAVHTGTTPAAVVTENDL
jgi:DNA processing protein